MNPPKKLLPQGSNAKYMTGRQPGNPQPPLSSIAQPKIVGARAGNPALQKGRAANQPMAAHSCQGAACAAVGHAAERVTMRQPPTPLLPGRKMVAPQTPNAKANASAPAARNSPAPVRSQQTIRTAQTQTAATQQRGAAMQRFENLSPAGAKNGNISRPNAAPTAKAPDYRVHPPKPLGGGLQQIRVMVKGTQQLAGSVDISPSSGGKVFISNLKVEKEYRRRGIANQLVNAAITSARQQGYSAARLEARPSDNGISSQALVSMYRRLGFKSVGKTGRGSPLMERRF